MRPTSLTALVLLLCVPLGPGPARAEGRIARLAAELARLRSEVETLSTDLETRKADHRARLRSLSTQKAELEVQAKREQVRLEQLRKRQRELQQAVARRSRTQEELKPLVTRAVERLEQAVRAGLPFKLRDRAKELNGIERQMLSGLLAPADAVARLWGRVEDELRLGGESGIYSQVIELDGREQLVEVARIGMVAMYFRTGDDRYGAARRLGGRWRYEVYADKRDRMRVAALFDAFKKQVRTGYFELPNALPQEAP